MKIFVLIIIQTLVGSDTPLVIALIFQRRCIIKTKKQAAEIRTRTPLIRLLKFAQISGPPRAPPPFPYPILFPLAAQYP